MRHRFLGMRIGTARGIAVPFAAAAAVGGLLLVAIAARSSPTHPLVPLTRAATAPARSAPSVPTGTPAGLNSSGTLVDESRGSGLNAAILLFAVLVVVAVVAATVLRLRLRVARHASGAANHTGAPPTVDPSDRPRAELAAGVEAGFDALERGSATDAVIACWLHVELAATEVGVAPRATETATEFVDRVLGSYGVREEPLRGLAALYREARFSAHPTHEPSRDRARACLVAIRTDLAGARVQP